MTYTPTNWQDGVTPVNAVNLNKIEQGILAIDGGPGAGTMVPRDDATVAGTRIHRNKLLAGDTQPAFQILGNGTITWGPGGSTAPDVALYRFMADTLALDDDFLFNGGAARFLKTGPGTIISSARGGDANYRFLVDDQGYMRFGPGNTSDDVALYRAFAGALYLNGMLGLNEAGAGNAALATLVNADTSFRFTLTANGTHNWGPGNAAQDTNLYRISTGRLRTDGDLDVGNALVWGAMYQNTGKFFANSDGSLEWGQGDWTRDSKLYRAGAYILRTNGGLQVDGGVIVDRADSGGKLYFGSAADTNLYRSAADVLKTDDTLAVAGEIQALQSASSGAGIRMPSLASNGFTLLMCQAGDPNWRFVIGADGVLNWSDGTVWPGSDTRLYRYATGSLATDGLFIAARYQAGISTGAAGYVYSPSSATGLALYSTVSGEANPRFYIDYGGYTRWGPGGSGALDVSLYRGGAGFLKTDGGFLSTLWLQVQDPTNGQFAAGAVAAGKMGIYAGPVGSNDVWFYRAGPGVWHTDQQIEVYGGIKFSDGSVQTTAAGGMTLIQEIVLGATGRFDFSSIPSTYRHLRIVLAARSASGAANDNVSIRFNGDNAANYDRQQLAGTGGSPTAASGTANSDPIIGVIPGGAAPASVPGIGWVEIPHYKGTTFHKGFTSMIGYRDSASPGEQVNSGLWRSTAAINRIQIDVLGFGNSIAAGSVATLYGIA